jgi:hypothetical protein
MTVGQRALSAFFRRPAWLCNAEKTVNVYLAITSNSWQEAIPKAEAFGLISLKLRSCAPTGGAA